MHTDVGFRFFAVPNHLADTDPSSVPSEDLVEPELPNVFEAVEKALVGAEFRDMRARDKLRSLLSSDMRDHDGDGKKNSRPAVFARPPQDLPALLRLADQLESLARSEAGERALVWKCGNCNARYAVPVALVRAVTIRCEKCESTVDLFIDRAVGEEALMDPFSGQVNVARRELATFFREAMARGWPVLVATTDGE